MKKRALWKGISVFLGCIVLFFVICLFLVDSFIKKTIETKGTQVVGARVELADADLSIFPLGLKLFGLKVTNPDEPMKNAIEISRTNLSIEPLKLIKKRVVIPEMALEGIRFNTRRTVSGSINQGPKQRSGSTMETLKRKAEQLSNLSLNSVGDILDREKLKSLEEANQLKAEIIAEKEKFLKRIESLPDKKTFDQYKTRIDKLKKSSKSSIGSLLGQSKELSKLKKDIQNDINQIKVAQKEFKNKFSQLRTRVSRLSKSPLKDYERLKEKYTVSPKGLTNMTRLLLGPKYSQWMEQALSWYKKAKPYLDSSKNKDDKSEIVEPALYFLIRHVNASLDLDAGNLTGIIENITSDQPALGKPTTCEFSGEKLSGVDGFRIEGILDHTTPGHSKDLLNLNMNGFQIKDMMMSDNPNMPLTLETALADLQMNVSIQNETIQSSLKSAIKSANFVANKTEKSSTMGKALGQALSGVSNFIIEADLEGTLDAYDIKVRSDLDQVIKNAVEKVVKDQAAIFSKQLKEGILSKTQGHLDQLKGSLGELSPIEGELKNRLNLGKGL